MTQNARKYVDMIAWEDCPHLMPPVAPEGALDAFEASLAPHQREARRKGIPSIGSGAVYPVPDDDLLIEPFPIPPHWGQCYGLDVGWRITAAAFLAHDPEHDVLYVTGEYYGTEKDPIIHAHAIRAMMPYELIGAIDPAARGANQTDGRNLLTLYRELFLTVKPARNAVEAGIHALLVRMQSGRFKVFNHCINWLREKRLYRRKGDHVTGADQPDIARARIIKNNDHLMDATRYGGYTPRIMRTAPSDASALWTPGRHGEF